MIPSDTVLEFNPKNDPLVYAKFFEKIDFPITRTTCWLWIGCKTKNGYGIATADSKRNHKRILAHRLSWMLFHGQIESGKFICHKCDIRNCVNPFHLFQGTRSDNMRDCVNKGRSYFQKHPKMKIKFRKKICINGHPYLGKNILIKSNGHRACRKCAYISNAKGAAKRRSEGRE